tara:strand:+ start:516 stop:665 length:150 start_codon:yes stop_codon:yes gene_type:complete
MIAKIIDILDTDEFYNVSESVEIAKGKNQVVLSFKTALIKIKRQWNFNK